MVPAGLQAFEVRGQLFKLRRGSPTAHSPVIGADVAGCHGESWTTERLGDVLWPGPLRDAPPVILLGEATPLVGPLSVGVCDLTFRAGMLPGFPLALDIIPGASSVITKTQGRGGECALGRAPGTVFHQHRVLQPFLGHTALADLDRLGSPVVRGASTSYLQGRAVGYHLVIIRCALRCSSQTIEPFLNGPAADVQSPVIDILFVSLIVFPVYVLVGVKRIMVNRGRRRVHGWRSAVGEALGMSAVIAGFQYNAW